MDLPNAITKNDLLYSLGCIKFWKWLTVRGVDPTRQCTLGCARSLPLQQWRLIRSLGCGGFPGCEHTWATRRSHPLREFPAAFVLDMDPDNFVEGSFGSETQGQGPGGQEIAWPASHDAFDHRVTRATDQPHCLLAGNPAQGVDLLADRRREARQRKIAPPAK